VDTYGRRVMARLWIVAAVSLLSPPFAGPGPAVAGLITSAAVTLCGQTLAESGSAATFVGPVNADCGNFTAAGSAKANAGFVSMGTEALFLVQSTGPSNVLNQAVAEARSEDILTPQGLPAGAPGRLVYTFDISGENHAELSSINSDGFARTQLLGLVTNSIFRFNDRVLTLDAAEYDHFRAQFDFGIVYGEPNTVELRMISLSRVQLDPTSPANFVGVTDFADTITLSSVDLLDVDGRPVPNASLLAASGTRYPLTGSSISVPEPSSVLLLTIGLIGLYFGRVHPRCALRARTPTRE
jgi:PEP-CTERM motif